MRILALDTSTLRTEVAAYDTDRQHGVAMSQAISTSSETLLPLVVACLEKTQWHRQDVQGIVCGAGPGSFTGLRIGAATAKGLSFSLGIPLVMISSFDALAEAHKSDAAVLVCTNAHQGRVYAKLFPSVRVAQSNPVAELLTEKAWDPILLKHTLTGLGISEKGSVHPLVICGDGAKRYPDLLVPDCLWFESSTPSALDLAKVGALRLLKRSFDSTATVVPNYVVEQAYRRV